MHTTPSPAIVDPTAAGPLVDHTFPALAEALRASTPGVLREWEADLRRHVPPAQHVEYEQVIDGLPAILAAMADALTAGEAVDVGRLLARSPEQGVHRFELRYDVRQVATEDRMLRRLLIEHVDDALGRRMDRGEAVALNWAVDLMWQQAIVAFVEHQNAQLREAAEAELKYLSFLGHDLNGNLGNVTLWLQILRRGLAGRTAEFASELSALDAAQQAILDTVGGMGRLLQAERLRHSGAEPSIAPVALRAVVDGVVGPFAKQADLKGLTLAVDVPADATVATDADLVRLVLQNLVANAVKYANRGGTVRVTADRDGGGWRLAVVDDGPGIAPDRLGRIIEAFHRGEVYGQGGVGLGLAIASRAAKLLGIALTVESTPGAGSTFRLAFPA